MSAPEFSRSVRLDALGPEPRLLTIEAEAGERADLAKRFGLVAIERLSADVRLTRKGAEIMANGRISAVVVQSCVASGEPVEALVDEAFELVFRPLPDETRPDEEVELSEAELDIVHYEGSSIDIGEAVAETMALSLDPFPRAPGADEALKAAGVKSEEEAGPFGALASLRDKLKR